MPKGYPQEFRDDVVAVARKGQAPLKQIAKDFGISEGCLSNWMKKADAEDGNRPGVTAKDATEPHEARKPGNGSGCSSRRTRSCGVQRPSCRRRTCRENSLPARP